MPSTGVQRRLTTILAADVAGYSRMMAADEAGTLARLKSVRVDILDPMATTHRGRTVKLMGDGILMEFGSVVDALQFAVAVQQAVGDRNRDMPQDHRLTLRIGVNIGDVIVEDDDIYGDGVNVAARLEALAEPGGICVSRTVYEHARGKLPLHFDDAGEQRVKNIPEPIRVYRVSAGATAPGRIDAPQERRTKKTIWTVTGALVLVAALAAVLIQRQDFGDTLPPASEARMAFPLPDKPSIAILPFSDLSEDQAQDVFADGMTEDLITDLSKISGLFVIASNSSFAFRDGATSVAEVAEALGVRYVLQGTVRRAEDAVRVNAKLIDATTGRHVWADRFDGNVADIFGVQDQFVLQIVQALELTLSEGERREIEQVDTREIAAREAFQRGWDLYSRFNREDNARSVPHFEQAVELDPEYGRAYGALALVHLRGAVFHDWDLAMGRSDALLYHEDVRKYLNLALQHGTALTHVVKAMQDLNYRDQASPEGSNRGTDDARVEAGLAIAAQPNDPEAHITMAWALIAAGRPQEGLTFVQAAMRLNPNYPSHYVLFQAAGHIGLGELEQAADILRAGLLRDPQASELIPMAASVYAQLGRRQEARETIGLWRLGADPVALQQAAGSYVFPLRWVGPARVLNTRLLDGLQLATLPLEVTAPSLIQALARPASPKDQVGIIRTLGWFGPAAAAAVPDLIGALTSDHRQVRREAAITLGKIGPAAAAATPALTARLAEPIVGFHAKAALAAIAAAD